MDATKTERRLVVQCSWCREKYLIPTSWSGTVQKCLHCGREGRAYGYLSPPERALGNNGRKRDLYLVEDEPRDCNGGLIIGVLWVLLFLLAIGLAAFYRWW